MALALLGGSLVACSEGDKTISGTGTPTYPAAGAGGAAGMAAGGGTTGGGAAGAPTKRVREIMTRSPFGDTNPENTLWDGDFEWSGGFVSQYPWLSFSSFSAGFAAPAVKVSGQCYSGLKCGTLSSSLSAAGIAASPKTALTRVRAYAKPGEDERCDAVVVQYDACFDSGNPADIEPLTEMPTAKERGYCVYEGDVPTLDATPCVFLAYEGKAESIIVDGVFVGAPPQGSQPLGLRIARPQTAARLARLDRGKAALRAFRDAPPPPPRVPTVTLPSRQLRK